ncbi:hypothetical protein HPNQ4076_1065 [Helicobacter pylori NQ4076]|uniref:Uncharacterized protein n=1 Tax=Helicobacter pylori NQ4076 TaxID=992029 RepID=J0JAE5_HELPX|nr:hypothetical protein HPNQ4076_1065 [Helicobacter pylori NQ4076]
MEFSLGNLIRLKGFKEANERDYQENWLNDSDFQERLQRWRQLRNTPEETNYREFEEIKKMVLYFRDLSLFYLDWYDLSKRKTKQHRENVDYHNELLQLDYSLANLSILKGYKERNNEVYQSELNDEEFQNNLWEWKDLNEREFEKIKEMILLFRDFQEFSIQNDYSLSQEKIQDYSERIVRHNKLLQLDYSLKNLSILKGYKETNEKIYQESLNDEELQNDLREWRITKRR